MDSKPIASIGYSDKLKILSLILLSGSVTKNIIRIQVVILFLVEQYKRYS